MPDRRKSQWARDALDTMQRVCVEAQERGDLVDFGSLADRVAEIARERMNKGIGTKTQEVNFANMTLSTFMRDTDVEIDIVREDDPNRADELLSARTTYLLELSLGDGWDDFAKGNMSKTMEQLTLASDNAKSGAESKAGVHPSKSPPSMTEMYGDYAKGAQKFAKESKPPDATGPKSNKL